MTTIPHCNDLVYTSDMEYWNKRLNLNMIRQPIKPVTSVSLFPPLSSSLATTSTPLPPSVSVPIYSFDMVRGEDLTPHHPLYHYQRQQRYQQQQYSHSLSLSQLVKQEMVMTVHRLWTVIHHLSLCEFVLFLMLILFISISTSCSSVSTCSVLDYTGLTYRHVTQGKIHTLFTFPFCHIGLQNFLVSIGLLYVTWKHASQYIGPMIQLFLLIFSSLLSSICSLTFGVTSPDDMIYGSSCFLCSFLGFLCVMDTWILSLRVRTMNMDCMKCFMSQFCFSLFFFTLYSWTMVLCILVIQVSDPLFLREKEDLSSMNVWTISSGSLLQLKYFGYFGGLGIGFLVGIMTYISLLQKHGQESSRHPMVFSSTTSISPNNEQHV